MDMCRPYAILSQQFAGACRTLRYADQPKVKLMRVRITTLIVSVTSVLSFSVMGLSAPAQAASFYGCHTGYNATGNGTYAYCDGGTGELRALATCLWPASGNKVPAYGAWTRSRASGGGTSYANCPPSNPLAIAFGRDVRG
jgi:hypothetical protein